MDWFAITDEEKWYAEFVQTRMNKMQRDENLQKIIHEKIETALKNGDINEYQNFKKLKKEL